MRHLYKEPLTPDMARAEIKSIAENAGPDDGLFICQFMDVEVEGQPMIRGKESAINMTPRNRMALFLTIAKSLGYDDEELGMIQESAEVKAEILERADQCDCVKCKARREAEGPLNPTTTH